MTADDHLSRLERLARLRDTGALSAEEFEREKAVLFQQSDAGVTHADEAEESPPANPSTETGARARRRWPLLVLVGLALAGGGGWALANWTGITASPRATGANLTHDEKPNPSASAPAGKPSPSTLRALPAEKQVDLAFEAVFGSGAREISVPEQAVYTYGKGKVVWGDFGPILIAEGTGDEPYPVALGTLGIFYLREIAGAKFEEVRRWPDAVVGSIMASPPQWKVRQDITDGMVIESTAGGVWQGYACDSKTLTELTPSGPRSLVTFASHYDSSGAVEEGYQTFDGTIVNVVRNRSFDVRFSGTRTITEHFVRKGAGYVRVPGDNEEMNEGAIPTC